MAVIRKKLVHAIIHKAYALIDYNIQKDIDDKFEFVKNTIHSDESLTNEEKLCAINILNRDFDYSKMVFNEGAKRICENCNKECLATLFCEHCVRNYLKANFSN